MERDSRNPAGDFRFSATLQTRNRAKALRIVSELGLDRLPDLKGAIHLLLSPEDVRRLLERDVQVLLLASVPIAPLDPRLIYTDEQSRAALEKRLKGLPRAGG